MRYFKIVKTFKRLKVWRLDQKRSVIQLVVFLHAEFYLEFVGDSNSWLGKLFSFHLVQSEKPTLPSFLSASQHEEQAWKQPLFIPPCLYLENQLFHWREGDRRKSRSSRQGVCFVHSSDFKIKLAHFSV